MLGTITAVGGGILRDMLAQRVPSVLKEDVYALPSIIGGIAYYLLVISDWAGQAVYGAFTIVLVIRLRSYKISLEPASCQIIIGFMRYICQIMTK